MTRRATTLFPLWAAAASALAYRYPAAFAPLGGVIAPLLGLVMLGMGLTLTAASFRAVVERPRVVATGVGLQYLLMPSLGWLVARTAGLEPELAAGLVLVGSCPGGTASNVIAYLAGGDVALSITMTAVSTLLAVVATPFATWSLVGRTVPVPAASMLRSILTIVVVPVAAGVLLNRVAGRRLARLKELFPLVSVAAIVLIIAIIVARNETELARVGLAVLGAVAAHNAAGLAAGYGLARALGFSEKDARTVGIEVGMQNSGLGVVLADRYFAPLAALPGAVFSVWHNLTGAALAAVWSRRPAR